MGLRRAIQAFHLWRKFDRAADAIDKESRVNDVNKVLQKGAVGLLVGAGSAAAAAALAFLSDPALVSAALQAAGLKAYLVAAIVPVVTGLSLAGLNWLKHRTP